MIHLNVRSLLGGHKFEMIRTQIENSNADLFTISETWLSKAVPDRIIECMNYNVIRLDRKWNDQAEAKGAPRRGGGLACYIKSNIKYSDTKFEALNKSSKDIEMLWVDIEIANMKPLVLVNLDDNTDIFLMGDFNTDMSVKTSVKSKELEFPTKALGLRQLVKSHTMIALKNEVASQTTLDLMFSNSEFIAEVKTLNYNLSDHLAVAVTRKKPKVPKEKISFQGRSYKNYNKHDFQTNLVDSKWEGFYGENNPTVPWDIMEDKILQ